MTISKSRKKKNKGGSLFSESDFKSKDGFLTNVWGPSMWLTLHTISLNYPCQPTKVQKKQYRTFFDSLQHVLPCGKCRENLGSNFKCTKYGDHVFDNRETLSKWVYQLHKCVNKMLGKTNSVSYKKMRHTFENFRARCPTSYKKKNKRKENIGGKKLKNKCTPIVHESGCTNPVTGIKSKCILKIVPIECSQKTLKIDKRCLCYKQS